MKPILVIFALFFCILSAYGAKGGPKDILRKSIVFDKNTPDVFYCPIHKPTGFDKLIVKARPLKKLCEYEGKPLPRDYKSDCYQDVDESDYACKEKYRIMMRKDPPGSDHPFNGKRLKRFLSYGMDHIATTQKPKREAQLPKEETQKVKLVAQRPKPQAQRQSLGAQRTESETPKPNTEAQKPKSWAEKAKSKPPIQSRPPTSSRREQFLKNRRAG